MMNGSLLYKRQQEENSRNAAAASQTLPASHARNSCSLITLKHCRKDQEAGVGLLPASEQFREGAACGPRYPPKTKHQQTARTAPRFLNEIDQPRHELATQQHRYIQARTAYVVWVV